MYESLHVAVKKYINYSFFTFITIMSNNISFTTVVAYVNVF